MARYMQYDNGIYGHRYKKHYIVKDEKEKRKSTFSVLREDGSVLFEKLPDYEEAEWKIDLHTASEAEREMIEKFSGLEIYQLNDDLARYVQLSDDGALTKEQKKIASIIGKIRDRKARKQS